MMGHNICFYGEIWLIIPKSSLLPTSYLELWRRELAKNEDDRVAFPESVPIHFERVILNEIPQYTMLIQF